MRSKSPRNLWGNPVEIFRVEGYIRYAHEHQCRMRDGNDSFLRRKTGVGKLTLLRNVVSNRIRNQTYWCLWCTPPTLAGILNRLIRRRINLRPRANNARGGKEAKAWKKPVKDPKVQPRRHPHVTRPERDAPKEAGAVFRSVPIATTPEGYLKRPMNSERRERERHVPCKGGWPCQSLAR